MTSSAPGCRLAVESRDELGGAGALAALAAAEARTDAPAAVTLVGRVGEDPAGHRCRADFDHPRLETALTWRGGTDELLVLDPSDGASELVWVRRDEGAHGLEVISSGAGAGPRSTDSPGELEVALEQLARCRPGDVLLLDVLVLGRCRGLVQAAYDADVQVVLDLDPPFSVNHEEMALVDVAVVDGAGAMAIADAAWTPRSLAVHAGSLGVWWDELRVEGAGDDVDEARDAEGGTENGVVGRAGRHHDAVHRFAGTLAAALATGMDRPEAFDLAAQASRP